MGYRICMATAADTDAVLRLYREQVGREYCFWSEDYPGPDTVEYDLSRDALFVMKDESGGIVNAGPCPCSRAANSPGLRSRRPASTGDLRGGWWPISWTC